LAGVRQRSVGVGRPGEQPQVGVGELEAKMLAGARGAAVQHDQGGACAARRRHVALGERDRRGRARLDMVDHVDQAGRQRRARGDGEAWGSRAALPERRRALCLVQPIGQGVCAFAKDDGRGHNRGHGSYCNNEAAFRFVAA
jgi:hypothetical protein